MLIGVNPWLTTVGVRAMDSALRTTWIDRPLRFLKTLLAAVHALGFMPGVLTTISREMVTIPRVELGGIVLSTQAVD